MTPRRPLWHRAAGWGLAVLLIAAASLATAPPAEADYVRNLQWYLEPLGFTAAHKIATGQGVKVCVVDSGIDSAVPDLAGAVVAGKDFSGGKAPGGRGSVDGNPHGTGVASVLAGRGVEAGHRGGVLGSAPGARLLSVAVNPDAANIAAEMAGGIRWCTQQGASVMNFSTQTGDPQITAAISYAQAHDVVVVAATGDNPGTKLPIEPIAAMSSVVAVSGIDQDRKIDPQSTTGQGVTIAAPYATNAGFSQNANNGIPVAQPSGFGNGKPYAYEAGTSLAAPIVAGTVALIRQRFPQLNAQQVIQQLQNTATRTGGGPYPNDVYGYGIVNAEKAVTDLTVKPTPTTSTPPSTAPATAPTSSAPASRPASASASPTAAASNGSGSSNTGLIIGIIAAAIVFIALVVGLLLRRRRRGGPPPPGPGAPTGWQPPPPGYNPG